ncbi:hypothetical protein BGZ76_002943 [Entomortierella beljakovae]|nr:hypothetical protein BGZ76_002943 [Entomortierella beljakovae]
MDKDMKNYAALLQTAKSEQDLGDLKSAYASYLKAHDIILRILESRIIFKDHASIESSPDNYTQLIAHAQEILRRIKDIVDKSKSPATKTPSRSVSSSSLSSKQMKSSTSPSINNIRPGLTSSRASQRSIATVSQLNMKTKKNVPMIPISPLTKQSLVNSYALSQVNQRLDQAKQGSSSQGASSASGTRDLAILRRLIEDIRIQKSKLDSVNALINSVSTSTVTSWDPDVIAKQLTVIDFQLFKDVSIPRDLVRADRKISAAQRCIDFETYVAHSVAHLLLLEWNSSRQQSPTSSPASSKSHAAVPVNAVVHMIKVANILLNVYRNFNSFMAIMRALTSPEIKRMHKSWSGVNSKTKDSFKRLVQIYQAKDSARCYREVLIQKLDAFQDVGKDAVVAIPWMRYHMDEVKSIINSYLTGYENSGGFKNPILSAPGARKLSAVTELLTQCRTNEFNSFDHQDRDEKPGQPSANSKHREGVQIDGLKVPLAPIWDLASLGSGDTALHHWLLSRPFLNKQQLIDESLEIEPLFHGEELPCYEVPFGSDEEESASVEEDLAQDDSFEHIIGPEHDLEPLPVSIPSRPQSRPSLARAPVSESEINDIMSELLNDDSSESKGLFDDVDETCSNQGSINRDRSQGSLRSPGRSQDVLQFLGINPEEFSGSDDSDSDSDSDSEGGDSTLNPTFSNKGKGKAVENDSEDIDNLLAQVKGLVHESRGHTGDLDSRQASGGYDLEEELDMDKDGGYIPGMGKKFEPFQQGNEDEFNFDDDDVNSNAVKPFAPTTTGVTAMLSLEALRMQLQGVDDQQPVVLPKAEDREEIKNEFTSKDDTVTPDSLEISAPNNTQTGETLGSELSHLDTAQESAVKPELQSPTDTTLENPFAPYLIKKSPTEQPLSTSSTISKGRRRKIQTDRTGRGDSSGDSLGDVKTTTGFSPPRFTTPAATEGMELSPEAIAARARLSLASHSERKLSTVSSLPHLNISGDVEGNDIISNNESTSISTKDTELINAVATEIEVSSSAPAVSIEELDKNSLDSSPPSFKLSTSSSQSISTTVMSLTTTTTTTTNSHVEVHDSSNKGFQLEASLMEGGSIDSTSLLMSESDDIVKAEEVSSPSHQSNSITSASSSPEDNKNKGPDSYRGEPSESLSGATTGDVTEGQTIRVNRQRRRKAGGVINVPAPARSLLSKASSSSLSGIFSDERIHGFGRELEQPLKQEVEYPEENGNGREGERHSSELSVKSHSDTHTPENNSEVANSVDLKAIDTSNSD